MVNPKIEVCANSAASCVAAEQGLCGWSFVRGFRRGDDAQLRRDGDGPPGHRHSTQCHHSAAWR